MGRLLSERASEGPSRGLCEASYVSQSTTGLTGGMGRQRLGGMLNYYYRDAACPFGKPA